MSTSTCRFRPDFIEFMNDQSAWPEPDAFHNWMRTEGQEMSTRIYSAMQQGQPVKPRYLVSLVMYLCTIGLFSTRLSAAFADYLRALGIGKPNELSYASIVERLLAPSLEPHGSVIQVRDVMCTDRNLDLPGGQDTG